jgi:membrane protease YdiL (CAAX protease family)
MTWEKIFLAQGHVRPLWRFFLSASLVFFAYLVSSVALAFTLGISRAGEPGFFLYRFVGYLYLLPALLGAFMLLSKLFEGRPLVSVGLALHPRWKTELGVGLAIGGAMMFLVALSERALSLAHFPWSHPLTTHPAAMTIFLSVLLMLAAMTEELMFRGYPFQRLVESLGPVPAVALMSVFFGVAHLGNPNHTWISTLNTMLVGVTLGIAYLRTRSLWLPFGIHFIWNFVQGIVLGLPVSGLGFPVTFFHARVEGAAWLTGGAYGPEGGLLATVAIVAGTLYVLFTKRIYLTEEMRHLVFGPPAPDVALSSLGLAPSGPGEGAREGTK